MSLNSQDIGRQPTKAQGLFVGESHVFDGCWFDRQIIVNGQRYSAGPYVCFQPEPPEDYFGCETGPIPQGVAGASVVFTPNLLSAEKAGIGQVWAKPVRFWYVPLQRRELGFSLIQWRAEQKFRDEEVGIRY